MQFNIVFPLLIFCFFYLIVPTVVILFVRHERLIKKISTSMFIVFLAVLVICVLANIKITGNLVTVDFHDSGKWFNGDISFSFSGLHYTDIFINLTMLLPLGAVVAVSIDESGIKGFVKTIKACLITGFAFGFFIEVLQFCMPVDRNIQLSDVVFNTISVVLSGMFFYYIKFLRQKNFKI